MKRTYGSFYPVTEIEDVPKGAWVVMTHCHLTDDAPPIPFLVLGRVVVRQRRNRQHVLIVDIPGITTIRLVAHDNDWFVEFLEEWENEREAWDDYRRRSGVPYSDERLVVHRYRVTSHS